MPPIQAYHTYGHLKQTIWRRKFVKENLESKINKPLDNKQTNNRCQSPEKYIWCTRQPTDDIHNNNDEDDVKSRSYGESWYIDDYRPAIEDTEDDRKRSAIKKIFMAKVKRGSPKTLSNQNNKNESEMGRKNTSLSSKISQPCKIFISDDSFGQAKLLSTKSNSNLQKPKNILLNKSTTLKHTQLDINDEKSDVLKDFQNIFMSVSAKEKPTLSVHDTIKHVKYGKSEVSKLDILSKKDQKAPTIKRKLEETRNTSKKRKHFKNTDGLSAEEKSLTSKKSIIKSCKPISLDKKAVNICEKVPRKKIKNNEYNDLSGFNPLLFSTQKFGNNAENSQFPHSDWKLERLCAWLIDVEKYLPTYKIPKQSERDERGGAGNKVSKVPINSKYIKTKKSSRRSGEPNDCESIRRSSSEAKPCRTTKTKSKMIVNRKLNSPMQVCLQKKRERRKTTVVDPYPEEDTSTHRSSSEGIYRCPKVPFVKLTDIISSGKGNKKERIVGSVVGDTNLSGKPLSTTNNWNKIRKCKTPKTKPDIGEAFKDSTKGHDNACTFELNTQCSKIKKGENEILTKGVHQFESPVLISKRELKTKLHKNKNIKDKLTKQRNKDKNIKSNTVSRKNSSYNLRPHKKCIETVKERREVLPIMSEHLKHKSTSNNNTVHEKNLLMTNLCKENTAKKETKSSTNRTKPLLERPSLKVSIDLSALDTDWLKCNVEHFNESDKDQEQEKLLDCSNDTDKGLVDNSNKQNQTNTEFQTYQNENESLKEDNVIDLVLSNTKENVSVSVTENIHVVQHLTLLPILLHPPCTDNKPTFAPHPPSDTPNLQNPSYNGHTLPNALCPPSPLPALLDPTDYIFSTASHLPSFSLAPLEPSDTDQLSSPACHPPFYSPVPLESPRTVAPSLVPKPPSHSPTTLNPLYPGYASPSESHPLSNSSTLHNPPYTDHTLLNELFPSSPLSTLLDPPNTDYLFSPTPHISSHSPLTPSNTHQLPSPGCHPPSNSHVILEPPRTNSSSLASQPPSHTSTLPIPFYTENTPNSASNSSSPIPITLDHPYMSLALSPASCSPSHLLATVDPLNNAVELSPTFIDKSKCADTMIETNTANETFIDELLTEDKNSHDLNCNYELSASEENYTARRNDVGDILSHVHSSLKKQQLFCREVISSSCKDSNFDSVECNTQTMKSNACTSVCSLSESRLTKADSLKSAFVSSQSNESTENKTEVSKTDNKICYIKDFNVQTTLFSGLRDTKHVMEPFCKVNNKNNICGFRSGGNILASQIGSKHLPNNQKGQISEYNKGQTNNFVSVIKAIKDASTSNQSISKSIGLTQNSQTTLRSKALDKEIKPSLLQLPHQNSLDRQYIGANHHFEPLPEKQKDKSGVGNIQNEYFPRTHSNLQDITEFSVNYIEPSSETDDDIQVVFCKIVKPNNNENQPTTEPIISSNSNNLSFDSKYQVCLDDQVSKVIVRTSPLLIDLTEDCDITDPTSTPCPVRNSTEILLQQIEHQETLSQFSNSQMGLQMHSFLNPESYNNYCQLTKNYSKKESSEGTDVHIESSENSADPGTFDQSSIGSETNCNIAGSHNTMENSKNGKPKKEIFPPNTKADTENLSAGLKTKQTNSTEVTRMSSSTRQLNLTRSTENKYFSINDGFEIVAKTLSNLHLDEENSNSEDVTNERSLDLRLEDNSKTDLPYISFFDEETSYYEPNICDNNEIQGNVADE